MSALNRREFLHESAAITAGLSAAASLGPPTADAAENVAVTAFASEWANAPDRIWIGPEYWANPLQDWRLQRGRIECINPAIDRNVHLLTRQLGERPGTLTMTVTLGRLDDKPLGDGKGSAGFRIGIQGPLKEYRNSLWFGTGLDAGITAKGQLFIGPLPPSDAEGIDTARQRITLGLTATPEGEQYTIELRALDPETNTELAKVTRADVPADRLVGNLALVANFGMPARRNQPAPPNAAGVGKFWFADWRVNGDKLTEHDERAFGPILFTQYTLHAGVLKLTAQMTPLGAQESQPVYLDVRAGDKGDWVQVGDASIHPQSRTASFRVAAWDSTRPMNYRVRYEMTLSQTSNHVSKRDQNYFGVIRRDPVGRDTLKVADISCNHHDAFPNPGYVAHVAKTDPDLLAFVGDQFYEDTAGYGVVRQPLESAILDYLRKWYFHGWTWRELLRDRPSIAIPDDHDVYQGNIWGLSGAPRTTTQEAGGYDMHPEWVNVVHRTQTSHHPDPHDPTPILQNISVYYGPLTYGGVSFAILADRMFKTAPEGVVPPTGSRGDHVIDPDFDPRTADLPGLQLLGERQMKFLREWTRDWNGAQMKAVISQTIFAAMATTHGANREVLRADYDTNGWPQSARNEALREIRKVFAVHLAGDQHLPALVHYGIDENGDAAVAFAGPAVNVGYPRWWEPNEKPQNRPEGAQEFCGEFLDHFGNRLTVLAYANGAVAPQGDVLERMRQKASGYGLVTFNKKERTIRFDCWPYLADPAQDEQFPGWPITVREQDNARRKPHAFLPRLRFEELVSPVVEVIDEATGELVYALRVNTPEFDPPIYTPGTYTIRILQPESGLVREVKGIKVATG